MASNAYLYVPQGDGSYRCARIRWSGYLTGVGPYLYKFYSDLAQAQALVARGWIESIEADPAKVIASDEDGEWPQVIADEAAMREEITRCGADNYLFRDGVWYHIDLGTISEEEPELRPVTRECLVAAGIGEAWLDDPEPPLTFTEQMDRSHVLAALENRSDTVRYYMNKGGYAVVCG